VKLKLGFLVNPYAGAGGRIGVKGSDGLRQLNPEAPSRAIRFLSSLSSDLMILTPRLKMGEEYVSRVFNKYELIQVGGESTTAEDTIAAVKSMVESGVKLICFQGGDGTALDVARGVGQSEVPVIGVPGGVKMHSGVFAPSPEEAAELVEAFARGEGELTKVDVIDADEESYRSGLYRVIRKATITSVRVGNLLVPSKDEIPIEKEELEEIATYVIETMEPGTYYIIGPGRTAKSIEERLGLSPNYMDVDVILDGRLIKRGASYGELMELRGPMKLVVTPIGGQGFLFGRGNQEIGPEIIRKVRKEGTIVVSSLRKVRSLQCLRVDTGDRKVDQLMKGVYRVLVGYERFYPLPTC
jgi:predicted polyphosphate/ATP-dependent NAD kinase